MERLQVSKFLTLFEDLCTVQVQADRGCRGLSFLLTYMGPSELKLTVYMQETSLYVILILDNSIYVVKVILDEPKIWVRDNT